MTERQTNIALGLVVILGLSMRLINLNYNSPFNDEAIYAVIGKMGLFQGDWWTYNAGSWMAGQPFLYPPLTAIAYQSGGIIGSRLLSIFFGILTIEAVFTLTKLMLSDDKAGKDNLAGVIAAIIAGTATVGLYTSRLATYDAPSYFFLILALTYLYRNREREANFGRHYFLAFVFLAIAFMTKIVIILFLPLIVLLAWLDAKQNPDKYRHFKIYFVAPFGILTMVYAFNYDNLATYALSQGVRDKNDYNIILDKYLTNTIYVLGLWFLASPFVWMRQKYLTWTVYLLAALIIPVFHILTQREPTLDKHAYISILFLSPIIGIGLSEFIVWIKNPIYRTWAVVDVSLILLMFAAVSYQNNHYYNTLWKNSDKVLTYLRDNVSTGDKVLAEVGAGAILATFETNYPTNTTTFDWFQYGELAGKRAYLKALNDGYFDWIELDSDTQVEKTIHSGMHNLVLENMAGNYETVYSEDGFTVYRRNF